MLKQKQQRNYVEICKNRIPGLSLAESTIAYEYTHDNSFSEAAVATGLLGTVYCFVWKMYGK